jgi:uncharacterized peroxidase-related enzyme
MICAGGNQSRQAGSVHNPPGRVESNTPFGDAAMTGTPSCSPRSTKALKIKTKSWRARSIAARRNHVVFDGAGNSRDGEMTTADKSIKTAGKAANAKPGKATSAKPGAAQPLLARSAMMKAAGAKATLAKAAPNKSAPPGADDAPVIALNLPPAKLSPAMTAYFKKCQDKLGFVPNVLLAYAFDNTKLETFAALYNDLMLGNSGLSKLEREMIAVAVSSQNRCYYCLTAHGAAVRQYSGNPLLGEQLVMNYRVARLNKRQRAMLDFAVKLTASPGSVEEADRERLRRAAFSDRDIWDISAIAGFFNMSNRVASATDMRPNPAYHKQAR